MTNEEKENLLYSIGMNGIGAYGTIRRFIKFSLLFWKNRNIDPDYAAEWASRFAKNEEYIRADFDTRKLLIESDGIRTALKIMTGQYKALDWSEGGIENQRIILKQLNKELEAAKAASP